ncbi:MAG: family 43 glycosylhydrolase [Clostridia bacterium]|nr:family 43 glycosylhydrolase [Clostridia bacterium]
MKNPISDTWYADPESRVYGDTVYMYVTNSLPYEEQLNIDVVMTKDLENYEVKRGILDMSTYNGAEKAIWAPTVVEKGGKYYIIFAANDIHSEDEIGGLYIGVSDIPEGPFVNVFADGRPLLNAIYNRAQPIDAHFFKDDDGKVYLYYGGWGHMMVCIMNDAMDGFMPMTEPCFGGIAKELTPENYVEAPYVMKIDGKYHLMYSSGAWTNGTYRVKAAVSEEPCGEFVYYGDVLKAAEIADGPGHNSAFCFKGQWYVAYHRRTVGDTNCHHRRLCVDRLHIKNGRLTPVEMT